LLRRIIFKAGLLFLIFNLLYVVVQPMRLLNRLSVYNTLVPGRLRLPFANYPTESYTVSILDIDQMLVSHVIARPKAADEYRVILLGDSAVWGYLLDADETHAACLNDQNLRAPDGRRMVFYNLGYPKLSVIKDLLILQHALRDQPDSIVWSMTLASLYPSDQLDFAVIDVQIDELAALQAQYNFRLFNWTTPDEPSLWSRTLFEQRREIADWLRYQFAGLGWAATTIDHTVPILVPPHRTVLSDSTDILTVYPMSLRTANVIVAEDLAFDVVSAGVEWAAAQNIPMLLINEPIFTVNDHPVRYNLFYPRWALDSYRIAFRDLASQRGWTYADFGDAAPPEDFTDTEFHLNAAANCEYAAKIGTLVLESAVTR
jgi:hypothetical protein